jgi:adenosylcobinamide-GDP ribazoletransferase
MKKIILAITFLTRLPIPSPKQIAPDEIGRSTPYFPIVGLILGGILVGINYLCSYFWDPLITNIVLVISLIALTGGLHLDGLMDTCDGIFSNKDRERTLEIMRDSRVGAMGVLAGICLILLKIAFLSSIDESMKTWVLLTFPMLGRWSMVFAVSFFPYARTSPGLGSLFVEYSKQYYVLLASIQVFIIAIPLLLWKAFPVFIVIVFATWLMSWRLSKRLEGLTGDTYGAICEVMEVLTLAIMSMRYINTPLFHFLP